ncbi:MAG: HAD family phosphatase [Flavobacteriaceae bacterium]|nr:HAD family phosphatase [Flavobacteriaceae bacterium]
MKNNIDTIIFDLGGVLIDWNPEYVYKKVFNGDQQKVDWFLNNICTSDWNIEQDAGRTLSEGTELLVNQFPEYEKLIRIFYDKWEEMIGGIIKETEDILYNLKRQDKYKLYALTNWSHETFHVPLKRYDFFNNFEGIVVSGEEKTRKPFLKIYKILLERYHLKPEKCLFIDDNYDNILSAEKLGINGLHYKSATQLKEDLNKFGVLL